MGAAEQLKASNRELRKAFGPAACQTIEDLAARQQKLDRGLTDLERKERILDHRTRDLRGDVHLQFDAVALFFRMGLRQRLRWLLFGTVDLVGGRDSVKKVAL